MKFYSYIITHLCGYFRIYIKTACLLIIFIFLFQSAFTHNNEIEAESFNPIIESPLPEASNLINKLLSSLSEDTILGTGTLKVYEEGNKRNLKFEFKIKLKGKYRMISYSFLDAFGDVQSKITILWTNNTKKEILLQNEGNGSYTNSKGNEELSIDDIDLKWSDLALDFLLWQNWETIRREEFLGRKCVVLQNLKDATYVNLWIDESWNVPLQWQEFSAEDKVLTRSISVKSLKKIGGMWMVKDVEIYNHLKNRKTTVLFEDLHIEE